MFKPISRNDLIFEDEVEDSLEGFTSERTQVLAHARHPSFFPDLTDLLQQHASSAGARNWKMKANFDRVAEMISSGSLEDKYPNVKQKLWAGDKIDVTVSPKKWVIVLLLSVV